MTIHKISHQATGSFSNLVIDYLADASELKSFYNFRPNKAGLQKAIEQRRSFPVNRQVLVKVFKRQYKGYDLSPKMEQQINALASENTFTVCTAHQPDLMTGYLYFFYKIIHAAKLADDLKKEFPDNHFVPVFYIGSEDNDFEELSVFHYEGKTYQWESRQSGAVGRMSTKDLTSLMRELKQALIPPGKYRNRLIEVISEAYDGEKTIAQAIRHIVHTFLSPFGVLVLDADDAELKQCYFEVMKDELLHQRAFKMVSKTSDVLSEQYKVQAYARPINLFYLKDDLRERIEKTAHGYEVVNTEISWDNKTDILTELEAHPERFSPNVILRGPYQETILPDVAFIGGGSEVAYWMQLKQVYEHYDIFFPCLILRQSALWMKRNDVALQKKLALSDEDLFQPIHQMEKEEVLNLSSKDLSLSSELDEMAQTLQKIKTKTAAVDSTLAPATEAVLAKINHLTAGLEKKMMRAEKRHYSDRLRQIKKLKKILFPNKTLQERHDNFLEWYLKFGEDFFDQQYNAILPFGEQFLIIKED